MSTATIPDPASESWISISLREFLIIVRAMALAAAYPSPPATTIIAQSTTDPSEEFTWENAAWQRTRPLTIR